jgi:hypothetical protein
MTEPPVCSSCMAKYFIAKLWAVIFATEGVAKAPIARLIRELRTLYSFISSDRAEVLGVPTLKEIRQIQRNAEKATQPQAPRRRGMIKS